MIELRVTITKVSFVETEYLPSQRHLVNNKVLNKKSRHRALTIDESFNFWYNWVGGKMRYKVSVDIQYHIYVMQKIERGLLDAKKGNVYTQEEIEKKLSKYMHYIM